MMSCSEIFNCSKFNTIKVNSQNKNVPLLQKIVNFVDIFMKNHYVLRFLQIPRIKSNHISFCLITAKQSVHQPDPFCLNFTMPWSKHKRMGLALSELKNILICKRQGNVKQLSHGLDHSQTIMLDCQHTNCEQLLLSKRGIQGLSMMMLQDKRFHIIYVKHFLIWKIQ